MANNSLTRWGFLAAALLLVFEVRAASFHVIVDTSALAGTPAALGFDLTSDISTPNSVLISGFSSPDGTLGPAFLGIGASAYSPVPALATPADSVTLTNTAAFVEYLQYITLGSSFSFDFSPSASLAADPSFPDTFLFYILVGDPPPVPPALLPYLVSSNSPDEGALFRYEIGVVDGPPLTVYEASTIPPVDDGGPRPVPVNVDPIPTSIPEPGVLALAMAALLALGVMRSFGRRR